MKLLVSVCWLIDVFVMFYMFSSCKLTSYVYFELQALLPASIRSSVELLEKKLLPPRWGVPVFVEGCRLVTFPSLLYLEVKEPTKYLYFETYIDSSFSSISILLIYTSPSYFNIKAKGSEEVIHLSSEYPKFPNS